MNQRRWFAVLVAVALFSFAGLADADLVKTYILTNGGALDTTAVGMADSNVVTAGASSATPLSVAQCQRMALRIGTNKPCRIAVAIKVHGDSLGSNVSIQDTTKTSIWSFGQDIDATATGDSVVFTPRAVLPTSVQAGSDEAVVVFNADGVSKWGVPRSTTIELKKILASGAWLSARMITVRWRVLTAAVSPVITDVVLECHAW